jgi:hypothetical protein
VVFLGQSERDPRRRWQEALVSRRAVAGDLHANIQHARLPQGPSRRAFSVSVSLEVVSVPREQRSAASKPCSEQCGAEQMLRYRHVDQGGGEHDLGEEAREQEPLVKRPTARGDACSVRAASAAPISQATIPGQRPRRHLLAIRGEVRASSSRTNASGRSDEHAQAFVASEPVIGTCRDEDGVAFGAGRSARPQPPGDPNPPGRCSLVVLVGLLAVGLWGYRDVDAEPLLHGSDLERVHLS